MISTFEFRSQASKKENTSSQQVRPIEKFLSNGIPVVFQNFPGAVAATYWWIQTGSADERPHEAGFAHFLEHMHFKDSDAKSTGVASTGQLAQAIESLGGDINAYTSFDQTVYHVTCAEHHWERVIQEFGVIGKRQKFLKEDFNREREVILEELKKVLDSPGRQLFQGLFTSLFSKHPYGKPVIGFEKTLKKATVKDLEAFYKRQYTPANMGLILVGPYTEKRQNELLRLLEKYFGKNVIPTQKILSKKVNTRPVEQELRTKIGMEVRAFDVQTPLFSIGFRVPHLKHEDIPALEVASQVLGMGEMSRLYQRLFYKEKLVSDVSAGVYVPNNPGMFYFQIETSQIENTLKSFEVLMSEVETLKKNGPTEEEMSRILVNIESEKLYSTQNADSVAGRLGFLKFVMGDLHYDQDYLDAIRAVDSDKVSEVIEKYLCKERMGLSLLLPKDKFSSQLSEVKETWKKLVDIHVPSADQLNLNSEVKIETFRKTKGIKDSTGLEVNYFTTSRGLRVIHIPRRHSNVVSANISTLGGLRLELAQFGEKYWGGSNLLALTWTKGTLQSPRKSQEIAALIEGQAASCDGFSGRNTVGLQLTCLNRSWDKLAPLFTDILTSPSFDAEEVFHSKRVVEENIRSIEDHSSQLCSKIFLETLFEKHPYGQWVTGSLESLEHLTSQQLKQLHQNWVIPSQLVLSVSGNLSQHKLERWVQDVELKLPHTTGNREIPVLTDEPLKAPRWVEKKLGREQVHVIVGGFGPVFSKSTDSVKIQRERWALRVLQNILSGQSGRLFIELREKKSLAYTVAPMISEGIETGYVGTYIACAPEKKQEALNGFKQVYEQLVSKGPSFKEMKRAKEFYIGRRAMDLQGDSSLATHFGLESVYSMPRLSDDEVVQAIEQVTAKEVMSVCEKYFLKPHFVTATVG